MNVKHEQFPRETKKLGVFFWVEYPRYFTKQHAFSTYIHPGRLPNRTWTWWFGSDDFPLQIGVFSGEPCESSPGCMGFLVMVEPGAPVGCGSVATVYLPSWVGTRESCRIGLPNLPWTWLSEILFRKDAVWRYVMMYIYIYIRTYIYIHKLYIYT